MNTHPYAPICKGRSSDELSALFRRPSDVWISTFAPYHKGDQHRYFIMNIRSRLVASIFLLLMTSSLFSQEKIDRYALVMRNNPHVTSMDTLSALTVGNGRFAFTVDGTGLQSFPEFYRNGVCLGTFSEWGWHSFPNVSDLKPTEALKAYNFGHVSEKELYSCQTKTPGRAHDASEYFRINPHRMHLGTFGFAFGNGVAPTDVHSINQELDMWHGVINTEFTVQGQRYLVNTACSSGESLDAVSAHINTQSRMPLKLHLPYPTGGHVDDACNWYAKDLHTSFVVESGTDYAVVMHEVDNTKYYVLVTWTGGGDFREVEKHEFIFTPHSDDYYVTIAFVDEKDLRFYDFANRTFVPREDKRIDFNAPETIFALSENFWHEFWTEGGSVDFSRCLDPRAREIERRVVLSQYLMAVQEGGEGSFPPQETGLTMNSWFGKFHLEMILWHMAWLPLWNHSEQLHNVLEYYHHVSGKAREIASRQGFDGVRWMKMTDPTGGEAPSNVGSFLIWQQPHLIYLAELQRRMYLSKGCDKVAEVFMHEYSDIVDSTACFMYSFANYNRSRDRYELCHYIPAQESLKADVTFNSPFELSQWHTTMAMAQHWREMSAKEFMPEWQDLIDKLSPLAYNADSLYLAAESAEDTYTNMRAMSDHPALLGALGFFPDSRVVDSRIMKKTLEKVFECWNWPTSWGWDFPMAAMTATRLGEPQMALEALLMSAQKNTYLPNGHNYQDKRLRIYLPGNGALLSAIALMTAGWDGCDVSTPGFPKDGNWDVMWENINPLP